MALIVKSLSTVIVNKSYVVILSCLTGNGRLRPVTGIHKGINKTYSSKSLKNIWERENVQTRSVVMCFIGGPSATGIHVYTSMSPYNSNKRSVSALVIDIHLLSADEQHGFITHTDTGKVRSKGNNSIDCHFSLKQPLV